MSMVHISYGMKEPHSPHLRSECAILAGLARAALPGSSTPWQWYVEDYDRIRDTMAQVLDGFEDFNTRVRHPHGFRISQAAREPGFLTPSGLAEFSLAPLPGDVDPGDRRLMLATIRSHDQFNTTIYSNDDRYRGLKGLRTVVFMNEDDMRDRGTDESDLVDITSSARTGAGGPSTATEPSATISPAAARRDTCPSSTSCAASPTTAPKGAAGHQASRSRDNPAAGAQAVIHRSMLGRPSAEACGQPNSV
jgi:Molydopterin dinucleotide binding domain